MLVDGWKAEGKTVGVVPTMGALHAGHISLVRAAREAADKVIVTIFVNPKQFNNPSDLKTYPRSEADDLARLAPLGVDAVYVPDPGQIYPQGFATNISVAGVSEGLCGAHRPGHFDGVATVVCKLLNQTGADLAFFGEKDYQQLQVVRRMVADLDLACGIVGCATIREADGLAMSSRNALLSGEERLRAPALHAALTGAAAAVARGDAVLPALDRAREEVLAAGFDEVEYLEFRDVARFQPMTRLDGPARLLVAARLGSVRLIDNVAVG